MRSYKYLLLSILTTGCAFNNVAQPYSPDTDYRLETQQYLKSLVSEILEHNEITDRSFEVSVIDCGFPEILSRNIEMGASFIINGHVGEGFIATVLAHEVGHDILYSSGRRDFGTLDAEMDSDSIAYDLIKTMGYNLEDILISIDSDLSGDRYYIERVNQARRILVPDSTDKSVGNETRDTSEFDSVQRSLRLEEHGYFKELDLRKLSERVMHRLIKKNELSIPKASLNFVRCEGVNHFLDSNGSLSEIVIGIGASKTFNVTEAMIAGIITRELVDVLYSDYFDNIFDAGNNGIKTQSGLVTNLMTLQLLSRAGYNPREYARWYLRGGHYLGFNFMLYQKMLDFIDQWRLAGRNYILAGEDDFLEMIEEAISASM